MLNSISINLFGIDGFIYPYTILLGLGFVHLFFGITFDAKSRNIHSSLIDRFQLILVFSIFIGFLGASLGTQLFSDNRDIPLDAISVMPGLIVGVIFMVISLKYYNFDVLQWLNLAVPYWCFAHAWGRIGCFLGGCCYGIPTDSIVGVEFPTGSIPFAEYGHAHIHPTQLYESVALFAMGYVLKNKSNFNFRLSYFLILYGFARYCIEIFRGDFRGDMHFIPTLSPSQNLSIIFIFFGFVSFFLLLYKNKNLSHS